LEQLLLLVRVLLRELQEVGKEPLRLLLLGVSLILKDLEKEQVQLQEAIPVVFQLVVLEMLPQSLQLQMVNQMQLAQALVQDKVPPNLKVRILLLQVQGTERVQLPLKLMVRLQVFLRVLEVEVLLQRELILLLLLADLDRELPLLLLPNLIPLLLTKIRILLFLLMIHQEMDQDRFLPMNKMKILIQVKMMNHKKMIKIKKILIMDQSIRMDKTNLQLMRHHHQTRTILVAKWMKILKAKWTNPLLINGVI
jgi:hypothetical protein